MSWRRLQGIQAWLGRMEETRRALFFVTCMLSLFVLWLFLLHRPLLNYREHKIKKTQEAREILQITQSKISVSEKKRRYQEIVMGQIQQTAADVQRLLDTSPSSDELRTMLTRTVTDQPGIQFLELTIDPPVPWFPAGKITSAFPKHAESLQRYQIHIYFRGGYPDTLNFLTLLAGKSWHLYWDTLNYKVEKYPLADVVVSFYVPALEVPV